MKSTMCYLSFQPFRIPLFCATSKSIRTKLLKQLAGAHLQHVANSGAHARECSGFVYPIQPTAACTWMLQLKQKGMASKQLAGNHSACSQQRRTCSVNCHVLLGGGCCVRGGNVTRRLEHRHRALVLCFRCSNNRYLFCSSFLSLISWTTFLPCFPFFPRINFFKLQIGIKNNLPSLYLLFLHTWLQDYT